MRILQLILGRFGKEASVDTRSEKGDADLKRIREEMEVLMELVDQVTTERPLPNNEEDSTKLSALVSQSNVLIRLSVDEKEERDAIRSSKEHCDFYVMFVQKLRCMVTACETRASGIWSRAEMIIFQGLLLCRWCRNKALDT
jgi:ribosomal protein L25 (general stress protein Ctc)